MLERSVSWEKKKINDYSPLSGEEGKGGKVGVNEHY